MKESTKRILESFCKKEDIDMNYDRYYGFYNEQTVKRGRSTKCCTICGESIPVGEPHFVETDCSCSWPMHEICRNIAIQLFDKYNPEEADGGGIEYFWGTEEISDRIDELQEKVENGEDYE